MHEAIFEKRLLLFFIILLFILIVVNLGVLDVFVLYNRSTNKSAEILTNQSGQNTKLTSSEIKACPASCLSAIQNVAQGVTVKPQAPKPTQSVSRSSSETITNRVTEFAISFGTGTNATYEWADLSGIAANIDSTKYGNIKTVIFEATVHIPTGNEIAYVRLFNATDKHPVWFSEMSVEGGESKLLVSNLITLDEGNKLYQVQMKTSLKYQAVLDQARVRITTY